MRNETRVVYGAYLAQIATLNGVTSASDQFTVSPTVAQTLEDRIRESADFLRRINTVPVDEMIAEVLGLGTNSPAAGRTNTTTGERNPRSITTLTPREYRCYQTNFDTYVTYQQLDAWAKFPDFQARMRNQVIQQIARDRLMIGWNGTSAAADTDLATHPLLQDVNVGWLEHIRTDAPERVLSDIKIGTAAGADYRDLDAAVFDASNELLDEWYKDDSDVVAIIGRQLVTDKYLAMMQSADAAAPSEKQSLQTLLLNKTVGGRKAEIVPFFPAKSILITKVSNLSIYTQNGSHRRAVTENPKKDRIEDYASDNEAYVVEDLGACAFIDGILTHNGIEWA